MMTRDKVLLLRKQVKAGEFLTRDQALALCDHAVAALVEIEGGAAVMDKRAELKERERQVGLALASLREVIGEGEQFCHRNSTTGCAQAIEHFAKARYTVDVIFDMLKAKGPTWKREWAWYAPRVTEEFGS
jgi:hypothetical protein